MTDQNNAVNAVKSFRKISEEDWNSHKLNQYEPLKEKGDKAEGVYLGMQHQPERDVTNAQGTTEKYQAQVIISFSDEHGAIRKVAIPAYYEGMVSDFKIAAATHGEGKFQFRIKVEDTVDMSDQGFTNKKRKMSHSIVVF